AGENLHRSSPRVVPHKFLVDFQNAFELAVECSAVNMGEVEIGGGLSVDSELVLIHYFVNGAGGDVARYQVAVFGIPLFQKVPAFRLGNTERVSLVALLFGDPNPATLAAG